MLYVIAQLNISIQKKYYPSFLFINNKIPAAFFEWKSGVRQSIFFLIPLYILAIVFCWFKVLPLLLLWLINSTIASFYSEHESLQILRVHQLGAKPFLHHKLVSHCKLFLLLNLPIVIVNTMFNPSLWYVTIVFLPVQLSLLCFAILYKYASYEPNQKNKANSFIVSLVVVATIIPFLTPIPIIMACRYYYKAVHNLKHYLHD
jgi:hypothetical protein